METFIQDMRYSLRMMKVKPGFTLLTVLTLALGIGANTAIFSVINAVLLRPLPYVEPQQLYTMRSNQSAPDLADIEAFNETLAEAGGIVMQGLDYTGGSEPLQVQTGQVTGGYFSTLGVKPLMGRWLTYEDDKTGGERVVVLSHAFWQNEFNGDKNILGKTIPLSGNSYTIVGVMPESFTSPREKPQAWTPVHISNPVAANFRGVHFLATYVRLKNGVSIEQARTDFQRLDQKLAELHPADNKTRQTVLLPLQERIVGASRNALLILFGAVGLVLLIACANFANLLLSRAAARQQELTIRTALGAGRGRIIRQLITESSLLAVVGGAVGALFASWGIDLLVAMKPANLPRLESISIDGRVLLFTLGISLATGLIFGLIPAWSAANLSINETLKEGGRTSTLGSARGRVRTTLIVSEIAIALVLLVGAGLLVRSLWKLNAVKSGFNSENLLTMRLELPEARYKEIAKQMQYRQTVLDAVNTLPGLQATMVSELPMSGNRLDHDFLIEGRPPIAKGEEPSIYTRSITRDYLKVMQIPILQGREFNEQDRAGSTQVGIINEAAAREYFPDENPIGKRLRWARADEVKWMTIIGVAQDIRHFGFDRDEAPAFYNLYEQQDQPWKRWVVLAVRSQSEATATLRSIKEKIATVDNQIPVTEVATMTQVMSSSLATQRFNVTLLGIFAALAFLLAMVGIYGVISFSVSQRTHEIGIRMALGAKTSDVLQLILKQGLLLALIGAGIGIVGALALTRLMESLLFGVSATDPITFSVVFLILVIVALVACFVPARRAAKTDPMIALRYE